MGWPWALGTLRASAGDEYSQSCLGKQNAALSSKQRGEAAYCVTQMVLSFYIRTLGITIMI